MINFLLFKFWHVYVVIFNELNFDLSTRIIKNCASFIIIKQISNKLKYGYKKIKKKSFA